MQVPCWQIRVCMPKVRCAHCGAFVVKDEAFSKGIQNFCDRTCAFDYAVKPKKQRSVTHQGLPHKLKEMVYEADGRRCRFCGSPRQGLHAHHVKYKSENGPDLLENLLTLCPAHHETVHSNKKKWQPICLELLHLRRTNGDKQTLLIDLERTHGSE